MSEALKILNNIRTLRAQARECTLETLEEMLEKLEVVVNERREEDSQAQAEIEERTRKLQQYREMLIADGIDPNELLQTMSASKATGKTKRAARPAKYQYIDEMAKVKPGPAKAAPRLSSKSRLKMKAKSWTIFCCKSLYTDIIKYPFEYSAGVFFLGTRTVPNPIMYKL